MTLSLSIPGISGRMGLAIARAAATDGNVSAIIGGTRPGRLADAEKALAAQQIEGLTITLSESIDPLFDADALIDFTRPDYSAQLLQRAVETHTPFVSGTTGFSDEQFAQLKDAGRHIPVLWASNMSIGVNLLMKLVQDAAAQLGSEYDIEIAEMHHRHKVDAPSGTALSLGKAAAAGRHVSFDDKAILSREGNTGARPVGAIGFATLRGGSVVGDHTVMFASENERLELTHRASNRQIFADGAVKAAHWLRDQPAGLYTISDLLA